MSDLLSTGRSAAKRAQSRQEEQIKKQEQIESARLAEETSEVERRKAVAGRGGGGRSLLIATSPTGTARAATLGGA